MTGSRDPVQPERLLQVVYAWAGQLSSELFWAIQTTKIRRRMTGLTGVTSLNFEPGTLNCCARPSVRYPRKGTADLGKFMRLTAVSAGRFYRFEHIVSYSSGKAHSKQGGDQ